MIIKKFHCIENENESCLIRPFLMGHIIQQLGKVSIIVFALIMYNRQIRAKVDIIAKEWAFTINVWLSRCN